MQLKNFHLVLSRISRMWPGKEIKPNRSCKRISNQIVHDLPAFRYKAYKISKSKRKKGSWIVNTST